MTAIQIKPSRARGSYERARARSAIVFLLPTLIILALVAGYPLFRTFYLSFTDANLGSDTAPQGVGFTNFWFTENGVGKGLLQDPQWWNAVKNTVVFAFFSVTLETILGIAFAQVINSKFPGRGLMRTALLIPWAIPTVVSAQMWKWMYNDQFGVVNDLMMKLHLIDKPLAWIANASTSLPAIIAVDVWKTTPFMTLLLLAGLSNISGELYEAAQVDGASKWTQFWRITLPLLRPTLLIALIFRTLDALRVFDVVYVMKGYDTSTISMSAYARQQIVDFQQLGYGSAVSVVIFLIIMVFTVTYVSSLRVKFD